MMEVTSKKYMMEALHDGGAILELCWDHEIFVFETLLSQQSRLLFNENLLTQSECSGNSLTQSKCSGSATHPLTIRCIYFFCFLFYFCYFVLLFYVDFIYFHCVCECFISLQSVATVENRIGYLSCLGRSFFYYL